jgi:hypothetical protein
MHRLLLIFACLFLPLSSNAAEARILKVLPHYLDAKGRHSLSPSLYERDAYQSDLRQHPERRSAVRFDVQWKAKTIDLQKAKLRVELRGVKGNALKREVLEQPVTKKSWRSTWTSVALSGEQYKEFGELIAWRVTLWEGDKELGEQKSFLW